MARTVLLPRPAALPVRSLPPEAFPSSDGIPMESRTVANAAQLLRHVLIHAGLRPDLDVGFNQFLYYDPTNQHRHKGPDFWAAVGVPPRHREHWETWTEGKAPDVVVEMVSPTSRQRDQDTKLYDYAALGVVEYYWFDPQDNTWAGYRLQGSRYVDIPLEADGSRWCETLHLKLVLWDGVYDGHRRRWLRWAYPDGTLLLTTEEQREVEAQHAAEQAARVEQADRRAAAQTQRAEEEARRAAAQTQRADEEARRAAVQTQRAEEEARRAAEVARLAEDAGRRASRAEAQAAEEARLRQEAEARVARLREKLQAMGIEVPE